MASCWIIVGLVLVALAFISSAISFAVPYWTHQDIPFNLWDGNEGLWQSCGSKDVQSCPWPFQDDFKWMSERPPWHWASGILFTLGILVLMFALIFSCINLCSVCCNKCSCIRIVSGQLIFAFLLIGGAVTVYGVFANKENNVTIDGARRFYWGYWVGVVGALLTGIAAFLYTYYCCRGRSHHGYTRGAVV